MATARLIDFAVEISLTLLVLTALVIACAALVSRP